MNRILLVLFLSLYLCACNEKAVQTASAPQVEQADVLDAVLEKKKLVALVNNSTSSYFLYKGQPMGFEYDLLNEFSKFLGVSLEIKLINELDSVSYFINNGKADLIAANLTVIKERSEILNFSEPLLYTRQVLVQKLPDDYWKKAWHKVEKQLIRNPIELAAETVYVKRNSSFYSRLSNLSDEIGADIIIQEPAP